MKGRGEHEQNKGKDFITFSKKKKRYLYTHTLLFKRNAAVFSQAKLETPIMIASALLFVCFTLEGLKAKYIGSR